MIEKELEMVRDTWKYYIFMYSFLKSVRDRPTVSECLGHPWLETEELVHKSPTRKTRRPSRRDSYNSEHSKKLLPLQQRIKDHNNNVTIGKISAMVNGEA